MADRAGAGMFKGNPIALGVAIAQPQRHVIALEGDGSLLMQLGCLATVAERAPKNLTIVIWDNGIYQITGSQPTPGAADSSRIFWRAIRDSYSTSVFLVRSASRPWILPATFSSA